jgi:hypothetical protein
MVRPGVYWGDRNRNIDLLLFDGSAITVRVADNDSVALTPDGTPYARGAAEFRIDPPDAAAGEREPPPPFLLRAAGSGRLALLGLAVANSSSDALAVTGDVALVTDLLLLHGRFGTWALLPPPGGGAAVRTPTWDVGSDRRMRGRQVRVRVRARRRIWRRRACHPRGFRRRGGRQCSPTRHPR